MNRNIFYWSFLIVIALSLLFASIIKTEIFYLDFYIFAVFIFFLMPVSIAGLAYLKFNPLKNKTRFFLGTSMLMMSGSLLHDFFWTARYTNLFTNGRLGGYDMEIWRMLTRSASYETWGIFAGITSLVLFAGGMSLLSRFNFSRSVIPIAISAVFALGSGLYFIDIEFSPLTFSMGAFMIGFTTYLFSSREKILTLVK